MSRRVNDELRGLLQLLRFAKHLRDRDLVRLRFLHDRLRDCAGDRGPVYVLGIGTARNTPELLSHRANQRISHVTAAYGAIEVVHINGPHHRAAVTLALQPVHLVPDGLFVVEAHPLIVVHQIGYLHLVVPNIGGAVVQHFADLETEG